MTPRRMRGPAAAAGMLAAHLVAGCSARPTAGGATAGTGTARADKAAAASLGTAAGALPECRADELRAAFIGGEAGAGNDFATIVAWDASSSACRLAGPVTLAGLGPGGSADTNAVRLAVTGAGKLTAHGTAPGAGQALAGGESAGWLLISAEYRDDPASAGGLCTAHQVEPAAFRLTLPAGGALTVSNTGPRPQSVHGLPPNGGLLTCRGELNTGPGLTIGSGP